MPVVSHSKALFGNSYVYNNGIDLRPAKMLPPALRQMQVVKNAAGYFKTDTTPLVNVYLGFRAPYNERTSQTMNNVTKMLYNAYTACDPKAVRIMDDVCHIEMVFPKDESSMSPSDRMNLRNYVSTSALYRNGTFFLEKMYPSGEKYRWFRVPTTLERAASMTKFAADNANKPFDGAGMLTSALPCQTNKICTVGAANAAVRARESWYCVNYIASLLKIGGYLEGEDIATLNVYYIINAMGPYMTEVTPPWKIDINQIAANAFGAPPVAQSQNTASAAAYGSTPVTQSLPPSRSIQGSGGWASSSMM